MSTATVSIVVPNFNKAPFLGAAIDSVLLQGQCVEAIFVDDASTDESAEILARATAADSRIRLLRVARNVGGSACRNLGLDAVRGEFVIFMDSDDLLAPTCCLKRVAAARASPHNDMWVFPMSVFRDRPDQPFDRWIPKPGDHLRNFLAHRLDWHTMQPLWRTSFVRQIGGFDPRFPRLQDPEVHAKALLGGARVALFPSLAPDCLYRVAAERHESDATRLADAHVTGSVLFYETFADRAGRARLGDLSGTLLACQGTLLGWWRSGRLPTHQLDRLNERLMATCRLAGHRRIMGLAFLVQRHSPVHVPGLRASVKALLGLP